MDERIFQDSIGYLTQEVGEVRIALFEISATLREIADVLKGRANEVKDAPKEPCGGKYCLDGKLIIEDDSHKGYRETDKPCPDCTGKE